MSLSTVFLVHSSFWALVIYDYHKSTSHLVKAHGCMCFSLVARADEKCKTVVQK